MRKFNIELTEDQMWLIANCMEDICRFASGQTELNNTLPKIIGNSDYFIQIKDNAENRLRSIKPILFPKLEVNEFLGYDSNPFIGNVYQVYRTMKYHLLKDNVSDYSVYKSPALPSGDMGQIKIIEIKN